VVKIFLRLQKTMLRRVVPLSITGGALFASAHKRFYALETKPISTFNAKDIDGNYVNLSTFKDNVCLIVNVASE
jgi:hypothetical protein